jgi:hypothetical protein
MKNIMSLILLLLFSLGFAQIPEVHVSSKLNKDNITIGDEIVLNLSVVLKNGAKARFPIFDKEIAEGLEIIKIGNIDTIKESDNAILLSRNISFSVYDSGQKEVPAIVFEEIISPDSAYKHYTNAIPFTANIVPVEIEKDIKDIKPPLDVKISWTEYLDIILIVLGIIVLIILGWYLYKVFVKKEKISMFVKPKDPPYVIALRELEKLKADKLWQNNLHKEYYSRLTDIFRVYIDETFKINAPEMITYEIITAMEQHPTISQKASIGNIKYLLESADRVKFAKEIPLSDECDKSWGIVYEFVEKTKIIDNIEQPTINNQ